MNQAIQVLPLSIVRCLASWLGISVLLTSLALAQVNGPGPSPANLFDTVLNLPGDEAVVGSTGGSIGGVTGQTTQLNVSDGGEVGPFFTAEDGSEMNISGGSVDNLLTADDGSEVNISGGTVGFSFTADEGSVVNISGGIVGNSFRVLFGSDVKISGGTLGTDFTARFASDVELIGGEFRLNGADFSGSTISIRDDNEVFTGTFADGSSFIFSPAGSDRLTSVNLTTIALPEADLSPILINAPVGISSGLRAGQTLTLQTNGSLGPNFAVVDATLNVEGGILGDGAEASNSEVNISGGIIDGRFHSYDGSVINLSGGEVGDGFRAFAGSEVNIIGSEFSIDGNEMNTLVPGEPFTITDRNVTLAGFLADGEPFSFDLNLEVAAIGGSDDLFAPNAMLTVTLGPPVILGDVNIDGVVDFLDISPFIAVLSAATFQAQADCDENGVVDFLDINSFIGILSGN